MMATCLIFRHSLCLLHTAAFPLSFGIAGDLAHVFIYGAHVHRKNMQPDTHT